MGPSLLSKAPHHIHSPQAAGAGPDLLEVRERGPLGPVCTILGVRLLGRQPPGPGAGAWGEVGAGGALC